MDTVVHRNAVRAITRTCAAADDIDGLLRNVSVRLRPVVGWDVGVWLTTDPATTLFNHAMVDGFPRETCQPWFDVELEGGDINHFSSLAAGSGVGTVERTTAAGSRRWHEIMDPIGLDAELRATFADASGCWGVVEVHRETGEAPFTGQDRALLRTIAPSMAAALRRITAQQLAMEATGPDDPGLWYVDEDAHVTAATPAGEAWLDLVLASRGAPTRAGLHTLAAMVQTNGDQPRRVRVRAADGRWLVLHAAPLSSGSGTAVIVEPARSSDIASLLTRAHGLSPREREVALAVARGETTTEMADRLFVSPHTIRDHVKAALAKVGVNSRTELVAALFATHYAEQLFGEAQPPAD